MKTRLRNLLGVGVGVGPVALVLGETACLTVLACVLLGLLALR